MVDDEVEEPSERAGELARAAALRLLAVRARTHAELRAALGRKGYPPEVVDGVLGRLESVGLVDDRSFAQTWVEQRAGSQARGRVALRAELHRKGVDKGLIDAAVSSVDPETEREAARSLCQRRARALAHLSPGVRARRLHGLLARRGYPEAVAREVVSDVLAQEEQ